MEWTHYVIIYYVHLHSFEDSDMTMEKFAEAYNANLANGIGNLASRLLNLGEKNLDTAPEIPEMTIPDDWKKSYGRISFRSRMRYCMATYW